MCRMCQHVKSNAPPSSSPLPSSRRMWPWDGCLSSADLTSRASYSGPTTCRSFVGLPPPQPLSLAPTSRPNTSYSSPCNGTLLPQSPHKSFMTTSQVEGTHNNLKRVLDSKTSSIRRLIEAQFNLTPRRTSD